MSEFKVRVHDLYGTMDTTEKLETVLQQTADSVRLIKQGLRMQIRQRERIDNRLTASVQRLEAQRQSVGRAVNTGRQVASLYQENEEQLLQNTIYPPKSGAYGGGYHPPGGGVKLLFPDGVLDTILNILPYFIQGFVLSQLPPSSSGAVVSGEVTGVADFLGHVITGRAKGDLLGYEIKRKSKAEWDSKKGEVGISEELKGEVHAAKGEISLEDGELHRSSLEGKLLTGYISGQIAATLYKDGKLDPSVEAKVKTGGSVVSGKFEHRNGTEDFNQHISAKGDLLSAKAEAGVSVGKDGFEAKAGAEAYVATGEVTGGLTLFGIKIDATVEGKAGGAGVKAGGSVGKDSVSGELGAGLGLGAGLKIKIDWSNAFWKKWGW